VSTLPVFGAKEPGVEYRPRPGAYALVYDAVGRVALVEEEHDWYLPGGGLEAGESVEEALVREVFEECGCGVELGREFAGAVEFLETRSGRKLEVHARYFRARFVGTSRAEFLPLEEACGRVRRRADAWVIRAAAPGAARPGRYVELSHVIEDGLVTYPGLPAPRIVEHLTRAESRAHYASGTEFSIARIELVANTGTYLDAPFHRFSEGPDLAGLALETLVDLPALVLRAPPAQRALGPELFAGRELDGRAVLFATGWSRHFGTPAYGSGHPFLTRAASEELVRRKPALVGIDSLNIDDTSDGARPAHTLLLGAGIHVVEHLTNLALLPDTGFRFSAVPPRIRALGSFPVRAFARLEP
jgi:kynurenine formamidase